MDVQYSGRVCAEPFFRPSDSLDVYFMSVTGLCQSLCGIRPCEKGRMAAEYCRRKLKTEFSKRPGTNISGKTLKKKFSISAKKILDFGLYICYNSITSY